MSTTNSLPQLIPYPWQQEQWRHFINQVEQNRLPHALLLNGAEGTGKRHFAHCMAGYLLCRTPEADLACGQCRSCRLLQAGSHPDQWVVAPEETSRHIKVDQIRALSAALGKTAHQTGRKLVLLEPAELLNINAANALLKNLEEPAKDTFFLLISDTISGVMATVRSRCQRLTFPIPSQTLTIAWLNELGFNTDAEWVLSMAAGAPLKARRLYSESVNEQLTLFYSSLWRQSELPVADISLVNHWQALELEQLLDWWLQLIHRILIRQTGCHAAITTGNEPQSGFVAALLKIETLAQGLNPQWLYRFIDKLLLLKGQYLRGANPNRQLLLEELLLDWCAIVKAT